MTRTRFAAALTILLGTAVVVAPVPPAQAASYVPISGSGSTWSATAIDAWRANVRQYGMVVNYGGGGSSLGRNQFADGSVDWAASDIPYGVKDGVNNDDPPSRQFAYMPVTAGGTVFMYNLKIGLRRVTNLRLSGDTIAKIFTGVIRRWNDAAIKQDNPGLTLPAIQIVPVVRSDGSGATAQFTQWMVAREGSLWTAYCAKVHRSPCTQTSAYPVVPGSGMVSQPGDLGVAGYVSQAQAVGSIGYVQYSYAKETGFPVAKMLNAANYYTEPTPGHVAVALLSARINQNKSDPTKYLTQDLSRVYTSRDPRTYPLSSYSYMILPTGASFDSKKGLTLGDFGKYAICQGQQQVDALGYSALPINLAQASFDQLRKIHGANIGNINIRSCNNPTFSTSGANTLAATDPYPPACDKKGPLQCTAGTGGAHVPTPVSPGAQGPAGSGNNGTNPATGGSGAGGSGPGGSSAGGSGPGGSSAGGSGPGGSSAGGSGPGGSTAAGGTGPGGNVLANGAAASSAANPAAPTCDADSGNCEGPSGSNTLDPRGVVGSPASSAASLGDNLRVALMALAAALLLGLALGPPLIAQLAARRRGGGR
jgi:phosphate ABC transporter phosphate-binding protein